MGITISHQELVSYYAHLAKRIVLSSAVGAVNCLALGSWYVNGPRYESHRVEWDLNPTKGAGYSHHGHATTELCPYVIPRGTPLGKLDGCFSCLVEYMAPFSIMKDGQEG